MIMEHIQTSAADVRINQVPKHAIAQVMRSPDLQSLLARGMAAAGIGDARPLVLELMAGRKQLWLTFTTASGKPIAAWITTIHVEPDGPPWVSVSVLAGRNARLWAGQMSDRMAVFARAEGASCVRFFGRKGWLRLARNVRAIGVHGETHVFERAVA
jgi:hypothetical protein